MLALAALLIAAAVAFVAAIAIALATFGQSPGFGLAVAAAAVIAMIVGFDYLDLRLMLNDAAPTWLIAAVATLFALPLFTA